MNTIRIGAGAGYSGDRIEPGVELAEHGQLDYLIFECLAERTIALAQQARRKDPEQGYDPLLEERMRAVLRPCHANRVRILTNMGAANPLAAARKIRQIAVELGLPGLRVAAITGDDVMSLVTAGNYLDDSGAPVSQLGEKLLSANAYLGAQPLVDALAQGADVIVTGRIADPALVLAPLVHEFGWAMDDWHKLGQGTLAGHLLECAGQVSGGYFADPGYKDVANLARLGFPIAEIAADGSLVMTKVEGSGGCVTVATCTEQLLYEIHDPAAYLTPDVVADFSNVRMTQLEPDRVAIKGATGKPKSGLLKVTLGYLDSHIGEGQISYAGPGALARAQLAQAIVAERLQLCGVQTEELRFDLIGVNAIHGAQLSSAHGEPYEVRLRVVGRTASMKEATRIGNEVETLYTCGPSGGGGATKSAREVVAVRATLIDCALVHPTIHFGEQ